MEKYIIYSTDNDLIIKTKREANIMLASLEDENMFYDQKLIYDKLISIFSNFNNIHDKNTIDNIIKKFNFIYNVGILSPLSLYPEEFDLVNETDTVYRNLRYPDIFITKDRHIFNDNAYNLQVRAVYDHNKQQEVNDIYHTVYKNRPIYISKGGIITGEFFETAEIRQHIIDKHNFTIQSVINIPVCKIYDGFNFIYVVDHREPKLKILNEFYHIDVKHNEDIKNKKYNIRNYKKLKDK